MTTGRKSLQERWWDRLDGEPTIAELLDDPVIEAVMARDGVDRAELIHLIEVVRGRLTRRKPVRELAESIAE